MWFIGDYRVKCFLCIFTHSLIRQSRNTLFYILNNVFYVMVMWKSKGTRHTVYMLSVPDVKKAFVFCLNHLTMSARENKVCSFCLVLDSSLLSILWYYFICIRSADFILFWLQFSIRPSWPEIIIRVIVWDHPPINYFNTQLNHLNLGLSSYSSPLLYCFL